MMCFVICIACLCDSKEVLHVKMSAEEEPFEESLHGYCYTTTFQCDRKEQTTPHIFFCVQCCWGVGEAWPSEAHFICEEQSEQQRGSSPADGPTHPSHRTQVWYARALACFPEPWCTLVWLSAVCLETLLRVRQFGEVYFKISWTCSRMCIHV